MAKMRAVQISKAGGAFEPVERDIPEPAPNQVRIKVEACGICHSDAIVKAGAYPGMKLPRVPGHEIAGRIDTVAVQGIGGLGHLGIQYARQMGFRTVAISRGADKEALARELGAHEYIDTQKVPAAEGLQKLGGADLVLATAPNNEAIASTLDGLKVRGKLLIVAAPFDSLKVSAFTLLNRKTIAGRPSRRP